MSAPEPASRNARLLGGVIAMVAPAIIRQLDMDAVVDELDVDSIAERLDLDALMARIDLDELMARIDLDTLVQRIDVNAIAERLDLDALMARIDLDTLVQRIDVDAIAERLDLDELMKRIDVAQLTAGVTQDVAVSGLDLARRQLLRADATVDGIFDRLLRRDPGDRPDAPVMLVESAAAPEPRPQPASPDGVLVPRRREVSGHYAGPVTRLLALAGDFSAAFTTAGLAGAITLWLIGTFTGTDITLGNGGWLGRLVVMAWLIVWFWLPVALFGRTPAMALVGLAVVRRDGRLVRSGPALLRALFVPLTTAVFGLGLVGLVLGRERRALYDLAGGTVEVYDWGRREAEQPATFREQLSARVSRRRAAP